MSFACRFLFFIFLFILFSTPCEADLISVDTINIDENLDSVVLLGGLQLWVFCDTSLSMTFEEVQQLDMTQFSAVANGQFKLEETYNDNYWLRFIISNKSITKELKFFLNFGKLDLVDLYQKTGHKIDTFKCGRLLSIQNRVIPDGRNLPIKIPPNQTSEFLFKTGLIHDSFAYHETTILAEKHYYKKKVKEQPRVLNYNVSQGFFYGFITFVMIFSLLQFILEQDKVYVYYALYLLGITIYYLIGTTPKMTTPFSYFIEFIHSFRLTISFFIYYIYVLFFVEFIYEKDRENPFVVNIILFAAKILLLIIIIDLFLRFSTGIIFYKYFYDELRYILLAMAILAVVVMIKSMRKDNFAKYILAGTSILLFFAIINFPLYMHKPEHLKGGISYIQIGILIEIMFFSIGLSLRSRSRLLSAQQNEIDINKELNQEKFIKFQAEKDKALFQQKLAETELKALRAQINPHFISNALNSIKQLVQNQEGKKAEEYLSDFSQLIRTILINSNESFIPLQKELDYCKEYLKIESLRFDQGFHYEIKVDNSIDTIYVKIPPLILQPYLENAIWHGLLPKEGNRKLEIKVEKKGDFIHCLIEDNGIGRAAAQKNQHTKTYKKSYGLAITEERIKVNNDFYEAGLAIQIIDKKDKFGAATGTIVELILPY